MQLEENRIADLEVYLHRMQKSILDKLFFIDKVFEPFTSIVDFGCANGELIKALHAFFGEYRYVGYDLSPEMVAAARRNVPEASFCAEWDAIDVPFETSLLNISSTVHEVYSYSTEEEIEVFWARVFQSGFRYVTIRDMMLSEREQRPAAEADLRLLRGNAVFAEHLRDYEAVWGPIVRQHDLVHFLLKYRYTQNWEREVRENYVALSLEKFLERIPSGYRVTYFDHYTLPYTAWRVRQDYGIRLQTPTHVKVILERV